MARQYLLDTNICVFYIRGMFDMNKKISAAVIDNCYLSDITVAELYFGAEYSDHPSKTMGITETFISQFKILPFNDALHIFGREMAYLKSQGRKIENFDMAIGSIALKNNLVMVTDNLDHFSRIRGLEIEDWKISYPK